MRLIFMGTPDFAVPTLVELAARGHEIAAVYTRAPKPAGRGMDVQRTPVEQEARRLALTVHTPKTLKDEQAQAAFRAHKADAAVVAAYGLILPKSVLEAPRLGCFNIHASLLPRWRGAAPINRAIMAGDAESGVTIMKMDEGLDTGAMAMAERTPIGADMMAGDLHDVLSRLGADLMPRALAARPQLSIVDVHMPYLDGPDFVAALKSDPQTSDIPVVFLTADEDMFDRGAKLGAFACLKKPILADRLLEVVARAI